VYAGNTKQVIFFQQIRSATGTNVRIQKMHGAAKYVFKQCYLNCKSSIGSILSASAIIKILEMLVLIMPISILLI